MDDSPIDVSRYSLNIRFCGDKIIGQPHVSIVICTLGREKELDEVLRSLEAQTYKDFEVILITGRGHLSSLRQRGLEASSSDVVVFIDDDVYCPKTWLKSIVKCFESGDGRLGVTGPTWIEDKYRSNRDIFKHGFFKKLYDNYFVGDFIKDKPSHLSDCGCPSMLSNDTNHYYVGHCHYLEACNMAVLRERALACGGFNDRYTGTSEWCELDLAMRMGGYINLWYDSDCGLFHRPSKAGVYKARLSTWHRWKNFMVFQNTWVKLSPRTLVYRTFVWTYLVMKNMMWI